MRTSRRVLLATGVFVLLGAGAFFAYWYQATQAAPGQVTDGVTVSVTQGGDRGPGSLREALFVAASADDKAIVSIKVSKVTLASTLPPLMNVHGMRVIAEQPDTQIDGSALGGGPVFDVSGANTSIEGIAIRNCPGAGVLLRASRFRLQGVTIEGCDVGVDVAENASSVLIESNRFIGNRLGVRFAASNRSAAVIKNEFSGHKDAALWAVRSAPDLRGAAISVRDNRFNREPIGILAGNVSVVVERNEFRDSRDAAVHLIGEGAVVRANRVSGGAAMGIVAENARGAILENNELDRLTAYGIMLKGSANTLLRGNRVHNCGYGLAFVLGDARNPSTAVDNTILEAKYNGIDVIGDSPILRRNRVLRPRVMALSVTHFDGPDGKRVQAKPFLDNNTFDAGAATVSAGATDAAPGTAGATR